ncbi:RNA polymerase sigma factor [Telmatospirillum sp.]|uniref:RNA polymerase sigma factor n=1 Tax=Telmatospirillum sp. TaxID=2079197 RepID=UPI00283ED3A8|nr:RNA polymerase sigma factor [Telmatospirillum sp.]MDR3438570.1 RNA polymerase sigma factor [Telmatospirillum sp.]
MPVPKPQTDPVAEIAGSHNEASLAENYAFLRTFFVKRLRIREDAEDCVHEVYTRLLASSSQDLPVKSWRGILLRIANSVIVDKFRRDGVRHRDMHVPIDEGLETMADLSQASPEARIAAREQLETVWRVLQSLEPECRDAFLMARVEGYAHKEIAKKLGIGTVAVGRHIQRALFELARNARNP